MIVTQIARRNRSKLTSLVRSNVSTPKYPSSKLTPRSHFLSSAAIVQDFDDEGEGSAKNESDCHKKSWQAEYNMDIQRVTQTAIVSLHVYYPFLSVIYINHCNPSKTKQKNNNVFVC